MYIGLQQVRALQLENAALKKQKQQAEISAMDSQFKIQKMRKRGKGRATPGELVPSTILKPMDFVSQCARIYATLHFPWEDTDILDKVTIEGPDIDPDDPLQRYPDNDSIIPVPLARQAEAHRLLVAHEDAANFLGKARWVADEVSILCSRYSCYYLTYRLFSFMQSASTKSRSSLVTQVLTSLTFFRNTI